MKFMLAFNFLFTKSGWFTNLMLMTLCLIVPVVGPMVLYGYCAEAAVALEYDPDLKRHPRFNLDRMGQYLSRGAWPFLMHLLLSLVPVPVMIAAMIAAIVLEPPAQNNPDLLLFAALAAVEVLVVLPTTMLSVPMTFHAKLTGRFDIGGALSFAWDFWMRTGFLAIGTGLVFCFHAFLTYALGLLCCFVGIYPATVIVEMAAQHLMVQLYLVYLDRGGRELEEYSSRRKYYRDDFEEEEETEW